MYNARVKNAPMQGSKLEKQSPTSGIAKLIVKKTQNAADKLRQSNPMRSPPKQTPPHRSLSQPSSSTTLTKQNYRPRSGGDEKQVLVSKFNQKQRTSDHSDDDDYEPIQYLKDNVDQYSDRKNAEDVDSKYSSSVKASASGIPLRIKSTVATSKSPVKKTPSRLNKPNSQTLNPSSRGGSKALNNGSKATLATRGLEMQFQQKKKKMELLKKDVIDKQNNLIEMHEALSQIQKKLEENGKSKSNLEDFKVINFGDFSKGSKSEEVSTSSLTGFVQNKLDPEMVHRMKDTVKQIPYSLLQVCKNLMDKRLHLIDILQQMSNSHSESDISTHVESLKEETANLESMLEETFEQQEKHVGELVDKWQILLHGNGDVSTFSDRIEQLQEKLKQKDEKLTEVLCEMQDVRKKNEEDSLIVKGEVNMLKDKIKLLETDQNQDKALVQDHKDKNNMLEQKFKLLKNRSKEVDQGKKEAELKYNELLKQHRLLTEQIKANEQKWTREKDEILTKSKHDRQMLDKLTKDRSYFETRVKTLEELTDDWENKYKDLEEKAFNEVEEARKAMTEEVMNRETMQQKYDNIKDQLVQMEIRRKQAIDLVNTKNTFEPNETEGIATEREAELYTELLATRVALKSAEEQIRNYNREKLRFIDSLQRLDEDRDGDYVTTTLVKSVEKLTELESKLAKSEETVCIQKIEIAGLKVDSESLKQRSNLALCNVERTDTTSKDNDLKRMLHEGRMKLEQSLKRSLEYEHRIIKYEHEMNKQSKQILEMENLLKLRDGLISMMKAKKDELQMENDSLNKYANEIRDLLLQAKEEARNRTEIVQELSTNLDSRGRICQQLEKKVKDLEGSLVMTNEKRFKLQDTLGMMEKELQTTKEHITKLAPEIQTRYGIDITAPNKVFTSKLPQREEPSNNIFNPQVSLLVKSPINSNLPISTQFPLAIPSNSLCCCNFVSDGKNIAKVNQATNKRNIFDSLKDIETGLDSLNVTLEPYSNMVLENPIGNQLPKDKPNDCKICNQIDDLQSDRIVAKFPSSTELTFQNENYENGIEATLSKINARGKSLNMAYANLNFPSETDCKSSQNLIEDKKVSLSMMSNSKNNKIGHRKSSQDCEKNSTNTKTTMKRVKYRIKNAKDNFSKHLDSAPLQSNQKKLKQVYDHIVGESSSKSNEVAKSESVTKRTHKCKTCKIQETIQASLLEPPKFKKSASTDLPSLSGPNTHLGGHSCHNHKLPLEMYLHCHHSLRRNDSSSSSKFGKRSTGSKPSTPKLLRESRCGSKSRKETLPVRERRKSHSLERKETIESKLINPVLVERTTFINHARNISRHFDNQRKRVRLTDFDDRHSNKIGNNNDKIVSIDSVALKSTEMEGDNVLTNCDFLTHSMNRFKIKEDNKFLLSQNLLKTDSEILRTTDSLPYL